MYIINESPLLANILMNQSRLIDINIFSTKGLLNYYKIKGNNIAVMPRENSIQTIKFLKNLYDKNEEVIIATDYDSTGELIALEVLNLIPNAKRLQIPFDNLLDYPSLNKDRINSMSNNLFNIELATIYIREITKNIDIYEKRNNIFGEIIQNNIKEILIPKEFIKKN